MAIDYNKESQRLASYVPESSSDYWKPVAGQYKVKALSEIEESTPFKKKDAKGNIVEERPQMQLKLLVADKQLVWTFSLGKSTASTYGQLVDLANSRNGSLKDQEFMVVVVTGKGKDGKTKNTYTIVK